MQRSAAVHAALFRPELRGDHLVIGGATVIISPLLKLGVDVLLKRCNVVVIVVVVI